MLGCCVPALLPLVCISLALSTTTFHWASRLGAQFRDEARPSVAYMVLGLLLGLGFTSWFFFACELHGRYLLVTVAPASAAFGAWFSHKWFAVPVEAVENDDLGLRVELWEPLIISNEQE